jgi:transcriptional regulator with XRE-family HTH domain
MNSEAERLHRAVGRRLQELRLAEASLSQERLAAQAGFHRTFVGKVERGESATTVDSLAALCSALGITLAEFFGPFDQPVKVRGPGKRRS